MGTSYLSRLWLGFILDDTEFEISEEFYEEVDRGEWTGENCAVRWKYRHSDSGYEHDKMGEVYVYIRETFRECDERDEWAKPIELPELINLEIPKWRLLLRKFCEEKKIKYKDPSWHLTVECW